jgi:predicted deacylase
MDGVPVISALDVSDLPSASLSRFYFRATDQAAGQGWYVPVLVAKGAKPGKRLLLTAAVHGDELNGIAVIQDLFKDLDPKQLSGVVIGVPGLNQPGLLQAARGFHPSEGAGTSNLNRKMPGNVNSDDIADVYAGRLWTGLFLGNADLAISIRTAILRNGVAHVQAGAGIVLDSNPVAEFEETRSKAEAPLRAVAVASAMKEIRSA